MKTLLSLFAAVAMVTLAIPTEAASRRQTIRTTTVVRGAAVAQPQIVLAQPLQFQQVQQVHHVQQLQFQVQPLHVQQLQFQPIVQHQALVQPLVVAPQQCYQQLQFRSAFVLPQSQCAGQCH